MSDEKKFHFVEKLIAQATFAEGKKITLDGLRVEFSDGWGLVRCSNTTPTLTLRFEADNPKSLGRIKDLFKTEIKKVEPDLVLDF
jgi:phosphomannomutase/phosphoglucomutase